jgi:hypothetical protein
MLITEGHKEAALMARLSSFIHSKKKAKKGEVNGERVRREEKELAPKQ